MNNKTILLMLLSSTLAAPVMAQTSGEANAANDPAAADTNATGTSQTGTNQTGGNQTGTNQTGATTNDNKNMTQPEKKTRKRRSFFHRRSKSPDQSGTTGNQTAPENQGRTGTAPADQNKKGQ